MTLLTMFEACASGLGQVLTAATLAYLCLGVIIGGLVGILPGLGGAATVALLLPLILDLAPAHAFALLIGTVAVTATTGDLTSILVGVPGEATAAATVLDGHPLAQRGEAGRAIGASLVSSFAGALCGAMTLAGGIVIAAWLLRAIASPELFMLCVLGICFAIPITSSSRVKGLATGGLGLALATVGLDPMTATPRFTFGQVVLEDGIGLVPLALGLFAIPEIVSLAGRAAVSPLDGTPRHGALVAGARDVRRLWRLTVRSSLIGAAAGVLPGIGASVSQWIAYADAARRAPTAARFGEGAVEGVIAPSAANNATLGGALVPMLALGIPGSLSSAMLLGALMVKGIVPGPQMLAPERDGGHLAFVFSLAWMSVAANLLAGAMAWGSTGLLISVTRVRSTLLVPMLLLLVFVGAFAERHLVSDLVITAAVGIAALALARYDWPRAPLLIGLVLGGLAENRFFLSISAYGVDWLMRPGVLLMALLVAASLLLPRWRARRRGVAAIGSRPPAIALQRGERALAAALLAVTIAALAATTGFAPSAAIFPRAALVVTAIVLVGILWRDAVTPATALGRAAAAPRVSLHTLAYIPGFIVLIWAFGFTAGAPIAVAVYLMVAAHERAATIAVSALTAYLLVGMVLGKLFDVPFPSGALLAWAGVEARW